MALDWTAIDTAIKAWLDGQVPGVTWMRGNQNVPLPARPCGIWTWRSIGAKRPAQGELPDDTHQASITDGQVFMHRVHRLQLDIYVTEVVGTTAVVYAEQARDSLELEAVRVALEDAGMALRAQGAARDLTALFQNQHESRAIVEIVVQTIDTATQTLGSIATADITPTLV